MRVPAGLLAAHARLVLGGCALVILVTTVVAGAVVRAPDPSAPPPAELVNVPGRARHVTGDTTAAAAAPTAEPTRFVLDDTLFGRSGALRVRLLEPEVASRVPGLREAFGEAALHAPAVLGFATADDAEAFSFVTIRPWREKRGEYVGTYRLGWWPSERRLVASNYANPDGFVEVTRENATLRLSTHFRLADFVTHDQRDVWPKYVVLREALLDKLELVLADLSSRGVRARRAVVLSGFRAPHHNDQLEGAAQASRHQFGDAADLIIDDDGDGRMDDLDGDGRVDLADTEEILRAVERVERAYPELVGGLGLYHAMGPSGPFAHIDVRGTRARWLDWGHKGARRGAREAWSARAVVAPAKRIRGCDAEGESAALCVRS
jgi:hypothetical protein